MTVGSLDANNPWLVALGLFVTLATLDALLGTRFLPRCVATVWRNNVADPLAKRQSRRDVVQREEVRKEVFEDMKLLVKEAISETLQTPNGRPNFTNLTTSMETLQRGVRSVQTAQIMQAERLQEVARVGRDTADKLDDHISDTTEFIAEQSSLGTSSEKGSIDRRQE